MNSVRYYSVEGIENASAIMLDRGINKSELEKKFDCKLISK